MPAPQQHDHHRCISTAVETARSLCEQRGVRLTPIRKRVLELVWQSHKPAGAYDLLGQLSEEGFNSAPPTVYRALDFLLDLGVVHRISSLNAFVGCDHPGHEHDTGFFICTECGDATELPAAGIERLHNDLRKTLGLNIATSNHELTGLCANCQASA
ncbi:MAG: Fur family transcriptional regulator [Thalassolituus sp.]|jgi:Fur family zinc uptake transcriptional regulator|uniref:Ferric uptake regulation protein n=1 Tax=Thalassolituus maritimus TaxID=484498 RepID=A0ABQ0A2X7_9GAMM|nr:Fur family transcriptional regulator [Pseudomonadota bacterium]MEC8102346.1 Fur family transcriptional regulator [Pseudomonadota bacterium]MEC8524425.1 Fur family transcriptional regulator [Pseudomonadota bacterium]MEE2749136.1 Fur family transcriptional regulator [Pseudomonadota bacterium]TNC85475.1 MAG: Fur family transcriptional regulator [Thalassolituus sp.]